MSVDPQPPKKRIRRKTPEGIALGRALVRVRKERGLTQEGLGWKLGKHYTHIGEIELGFQRPRIDTVIQLARALEITPTALFDATMIELELLENEESRKTRTAKTGMAKAGATTRTPPARTSK